MSNKPLPIYTVNNCDGILEHKPGTQGAGGESQQNSKEIGKQVQGKK